MLVTAPIDSSHDWPHVQMIAARLSCFVHSSLFVFVQKLTGSLYSMQLDPVFDSRLQFKDSYG